MSSASSELARRALAAGETRRWRVPRSRCTAVSCSRRTATRTWAEERREQLRLRQLELLRLDGRWEAVVDLDPGDEVAHRRT